MSMEIFSVGDWVRFRPFDIPAREDIELLVHVMNIGKPGPFLVTEVEPYFGLPEKQRHSQNVVILIPRTENGHIRWTGRFQGSDLRHVQYIEENLPGLIPVASA